MPPRGSAGGRRRPGRQPRNSRSGSVAVKAADFSRKSGILRIGRIRVF